MIGAILAATVADSAVFIDLTSNNSALGTLPLPDQGAMALMVTDSTDSIFTLPVDSPEKRSISRKMDIVLSDDGTVSITIDTEKHSIFATSMRNSFRYSSHKEQIKEMQEILQDGSSSTTVDSLIFEDLDTLGESVKYRVVYRVENGISIGANTALYKLDIPDRLRSSYFPVIAGRETPVSLRQYYRSISDLTSEVSIRYPEAWNLSNSADTLQYSSNSGDYSLEISKKGNSLKLHRKVKMNFNKGYTIEEFKPEHEFLSNGLLADNIELIFTK